MDNRKTNPDDILLIVTFACGIPWVLTGGLLLIVYGFMLFASFYILGMILEKKRKDIKNYRLSSWIKIAMILLCLSFIATAGHYSIPDEGAWSVFKSPLILPSVLLFPLMISLPMAIYFDK